MDAVEPFLSYLEAFRAGCGLRLGFLSDASRIAVDIENRVLTCEDVQNMPEDSDEVFLLEHYWLHITEGIAQ